MKERLSHFQKYLHEEAALIENPTDLFYLTGLMLSLGSLLVTKKDAALFVDGRYFAIAEKKAPCPVKLVKEGTQPMKEWLQERNVQTLAFDSATSSYERFEGLQKMLPGVRLVPQGSLLKQARSIKGPSEIASLKKAQALTHKGFQHMEKLLKEGITEEEVAFEFEVFIRKHGASGCSFGPIVAFGENSAYPHHRAGKTKLAKNQVVLIDIGAIVEEYRGDFTRVVFFGEPNPTLQKWLEIVLLAQKKAMEAIREGVLVKELDLIARKIFAEHGLEEKFCHGLGHGIGLETHEFPSLKAAGIHRDVKLEKGMVITIEPGLYQPGLGGLRWEDMVLVLEHGYEQF